jgi:hypothetical protein
MMHPTVNRLNDSAAVLVEGFLRYTRKVKVIANPKECDTGICITLYPRGRWRDVNIFSFAVSSSCKHLV